MKAKLKEKEVSTVLPEGMQARDLTYDKRSELFQKALDVFLEENNKQLGIGLGAQIVWAREAAIPRIVLTDLLKKKDETKPTENKEEPKS